jgi:hypothetical protein
MAVICYVAYSARAFITVIHFHPILMFVGKARAYPSSGFTQVGFKCLQILDQGGSD